MSEQQSVTVSILDRDYKLACTAEEQARLREAARILDQRMRELKGSGKMVGQEKVAVLVGLDLAAEYLEIRDRCERLERDVDARVRVLSELLQETSAADQ